MKYEVIDIRTGESKGKYATYKAATRCTDKLDLAYGAIRYTVKFI